DQQGRQDQRELGAKGQAPRLPRPQRQSQPRRRRPRPIRISAPLFPPGGAALPRRPTLRVRVGPREGPALPRASGASVTSLTVVLTAVAIFVDVVAADLLGRRVYGAVVVVAVLAPDEAVVVGVGAAAGPHALQPGGDQLLPLPEVAVDPPDR